jgi:hypothetical protein
LGLRTGRIRIFTVDGSGIGGGAITHGDNSLVNAAKPAHASDGGHRRRPATALFNGLSQGPGCPFY